MEKYIFGTFWFWLIIFFTKKFFIFEKKFGWNSVNLKKNRLIFEEKESKQILKIIFAILLFLKKKSVKSRLIHQLKDRKLSVKMSVNLGYFRLKHRLHNLPGIIRIMETRKHAHGKIIVSVHVDSKNNII